MKKKSYLFLACLLLSPFASAHLMVAQHGTLNIVDDGAFMVLSIAMSSFQGIDDNNDGNISLIEFNLHRPEIVQAIKSDIKLRDAKGNCALEGIMLSPVEHHEGQGDSISQLAVMGRFTLAAPEQPLELHIGLYGHNTHEKAVEVSARHKTKMDVIQLTPGSPSGKFFDQR